MSNRWPAKVTLSMKNMGALLSASGLWLCSCAGASSGSPAEPAADSTQEQPTSKESESSRPVSTIPTTLTLELAGEKLSLPASARLQLGVDGTIELSAATQTAGNLFSMRLRVPSDTRTLKGASFELAQGLDAENELGIVRGELPNATALRSVAGTVRIVELEEKKLELTFDAMLSKDPRVGSDAVHATGMLTGVANLVCLQKSTAPDGVRVESADGQSQAVSAIRLDDARCQPLVKLLDKD